MTNTNISYAENGENVVSLYNFARLDGKNKLNKKDAVGFVAEHVGLSKAEVGRILNYGQENGDYVFSNKAYREALADDVYRATKAGADIETIADSYGISRSTARKYSHPTFEVAEAEVRNDPNAIAIVADSSYDEPRMQNTRFGESLERAETAIVNGVKKAARKAYDVVNVASDSVDRGLSALESWLATGVREQGLAFASMGAASADDPIFKKDSENKAVPPLSDDYHRALAAANSGRKETSFAERAGESLTKACDAVGSWLGRNARAVALGAAVFATGVAGAYGLSSLVSSHDSGRKAERISVTAQANQGDRVYKNANVEVKRPILEEPVQSQPYDEVQRDLDFAAARGSEKPVQSDIQPAEIHPDIQAALTQPESKPAVEYPGVSPKEVPGIQEPVQVNRASDWDIQIVTTGAGQPSMTETARVLRNMGEGGEGMKLLRKAGLEDSAEYGKCYAENGALFRPILEGTSDFIPFIEGKLVKKPQARKPQESNNVLLRHLSPKDNYVIALPKGRGYTFVSDFSGNTNVDVLTGEEFREYKAEVAEREPEVADALGMQGFALKIYGTGAHGNRTNPELPRMASSAIPLSLDEMLDIFDGNGDLSPELNDKLADNGIDTGKLLYLVNTSKGREPTGFWKHGVFGKRPGPVADGRLIAVSGDVIDGFLSCYVPEAGRLIHTPLSLEQMAMGRVNGAEKISGDLYSQEQKDNPRTVVKWFERILALAGLAHQAGHNGGGHGGGSSSGGGAGGQAAPAPHNW